MHIKRFEGSTMLEAVRKVKEELGPDALILSTRTLRKSGARFGWFGRPVVEVTAAVDRDARRAAQDAALRGASPLDVRRELAAAAEPPARERVAPDASWRELQISKALVDPLESEVRELRRAVDRMALARPESDPALRELADLRRAIAELLSRSEPRAGDAAEAGARPDAGASRAAHRLLGSGLAHRHAVALSEELAGAPEREANGEPALCAALARRLDARMAPPRLDDVPRVSLFVGPTGAGKTTTLAKLAARFSAGDPVSVVTTDCFRIGAEAQLRSVADRLEVPFDVAASASDLAERVARRSGRSVLVDTAGCSASDADALPELRRFRDALGTPSRVHLVLPATTKESDLRNELARYRALDPDSLIVTKVDESGDLGNLANLLLDADTPPLSWLGTGQRVPEDLGLPDPRELAQRILGAAS